MKPNKFFHEISRIPTAPGSPKDHPPNWKRLLILFDIESASCGYGIGIPATFISLNLNRNTPIMIGT
jgi:hypothetical protein